MERGKKEEEIKRMDIVEIEKGQNEGHSRIYMKTGMLQQPQIVAPMFR